MQSFPLYHQLPSILITGSQMLAPGGRLVLTPLQGTQSEQWQCCHRFLGLNFHRVKYSANTHVRTPHSIRIDETSTTALPTG